MVSVAQDQFYAKFDEIGWTQRLHCRQCSNWREYRCMDSAVGRMVDSGSGTRFMVNCLKFELEHGGDYTARKRFDTGATLLDVADSEY